RFGSLQLGGVVGATVSADRKADWSGCWWVGVANTTISSANFICLTICLPLPSCNFSVQSSLSKEEKKEKK
ncbi:hypothetical protein A2U01_0092602, partial [Trifolium medium]|nr:hypothetical protein [Trifolium medium]